MRFLADRLLHRVEGYSDRHFCASAGGCLQAKCAPKLACTLLHNWDAKVSSTRSGPVGSIKSLAVIPDRQVKGVTLIFEMDGDIRRVGMSNGVRYSLLTDADKVMDAAGGKWNLVAFDVQRGADYVLHMIGGEGTGQRLRENIRDFLGIAEVPDNASSFGLTVRHHAPGKLAGLGCRRGFGITVTEELRRGLQLPRDCCEPCHQGVVTLTGDAITLLKYDADPPFHELNATPEELYRDRGS